MELTLVAQLPLDVDCAPFSDWLRSNGIPHQFVERAGVLEVYVEPKCALVVQRALQAFVEEPETRAKIVEFARTTHTSDARTERFFRNFLQCPVVSSVIFLCLLVAVVTLLGHGGPVLRALVFADPFQVADDTFHDRLNAVGYVFSSFQLWRLVTPAFVHFSLLHLVFNMLWLWYFGRRVEQSGGGLFFGILCLMLAAGSNMVQYLLTGPLFGGMSGVVYGLLGYCWMMDFGQQVKRFHVPDALMAFMTVWLLLGFTDMTQWLGMGRMANGAHLSGLILGVIAGFRGRVARQ